MISTIADALRRRPLAAFAGVAAAATLLRVAGLAVSEADLGPDEAQYWFWSTAPALGYYSKPPLIAWVIAAATSAFGDDEWAVRLAAPFFHAGAALFLFSLARRLYDDRTAFWTGLGWLLLPGAALSSALMTTDAPLLFFWSAALFFFFRMLTAVAGGARLKLALGLGAAIGLGMLSKYAMIYFPVGVAAAFAFSPALRKNARALQLIAAAALGLAILSPNIAWNAANHFATLAHTAANADLGRAAFHPKALVAFWGAQFGVFGPILLLLLGWGVGTFPRRTTAPHRDVEIALLCFAAAPLAIVSVGALLSRAHGNWAATAYPSALLLVTAWAFRANVGGVLKISAGLHAALAIALLVVLANLRYADAIGLSRAVKPLRGWAEQVAQIRLAASGLDAIVVVDRETTAEILYYGRGGPSVYALNPDGRVDNHFEAFFPYRPRQGARVLYVDTHADAPAAHAAFSSVVSKGPVVADFGGGRVRALYVFEASDPILR